MTRLASRRSIAAKCQSCRSAGRLRKILRFALDDEGWGMIGRGLPDFRQGCPKWQLLTIPLIDIDAIQPL